MRIKKIDFVGFTVRGPTARQMVMSQFVAGGRDWGDKWSARAEGSAVILEGEGRKIECPRHLCVIEWEATADEKYVGEPDVVVTAEQAELAEQMAAGVYKRHGVSAMAATPKRRGRPPKVQPEPPEAA